MPLPLYSVLTHWRLIAGRFRGKNSSAAQSTISVRSGFPCVILHPLFNYFRCFCPEFRVSTRSDGHGKLVVVEQYFSFRLNGSLLSSWEMFGGRWFVCAACRRRRVDRVLAIIHLFVINPFTAPACKMSGPKAAVLCVLMKILSHASAKKKTKRIKGFRFRTLIGRFLAMSLL